jgi:hypothetical protein
MRARQVIDGLKTPILGVVLSRVPQGTGDDYGYYTKNYAYYSDRGHRKRSDGKSATPRTGPERLELRETDRGKRG